VPGVTEPSLAGGVVEVVAARRRTFGTPLIDFVDEVVVDDSLRARSRSLLFTSWAPRFWFSGRPPIGGPEKAIYWVEPGEEERLRRG